ncbi:MAG: heterodisulfide reductase-related iron-sulfur binding cluster, partial [Longimicrobiales bacterium]|nr:heterodisulfide reductase-related iron-sulfur binding cluster [Longimicrobiales bacterium]
GAAMLESSSPARGRRGGRRGGSAEGGKAASGASVALLPGCVQGGLFGRVVDASERVLARNGCRVVRFGAGGCCGALHAHAGERGGALTLARRRIVEGERLGVEFVATDAAGCGAAMKEYAEWFEDDPEWAERAAAFSARVRDVTEILDDLGPAPGGRVRRCVVHAPPCHLRHAQLADAATEGVLAAIPGLEVRTVVDPDACCGGAGIYGITHPGLGGAIGERKIAAVRATCATEVVAGNPGCMMQIGAGLLLSGSEVRAVHPVELLDESYRARDDER